MNTAKTATQAVLSNQGDMTSFRYADYNIRFRTPSILKKYVDVKSWDDGYIVVMADYEGMGITEEYIDLVPILKNLYIKPETFLKNIQTVKIGDYEQLRFIKGEFRSRHDSLRLCIFEDRRLQHTCVRP